MAVTFLNDVSLGSDIELQLASSSGGKIFANSKFYIQGDAINFKNYAGTETYAIFENNGSVSLRYDDTVRFQTSSVGATVSGQLTVSNGIEMTGGNFNAGDSDRIRLGSSADLQMYHDGSNSYLLNSTNDFYIDSNGDDLYLRATDDVIIQSQGSENAVYCTGNAGVALYHNASSKFTTTQDGVSVTGDCELTSNGDLILDADSGIQLNIASTGSEGNGIIIKLHTTSTTFGKLYYKSNFAAAWSLADADSDGATRMLGMALGSTASNDGMLLQGIIRIASHGLSAGAPIYVSTTAGELTTTAPSGSGDYVRVVGYTIDSNLIYFNPSGTWVEVA